MTQDQSACGKVDGGPTLDRRSFVLATMAAAVCACCGTVDEALAQTTRPATAGSTVDVGPLTTYAKDGVTDSFINSSRLLVIRNEGRLYATTALCTHRNKPVSVTAKGIICKSHGSEFSNFGTVTKGPAKDSLIRYAISVKDGKVVVDTTKTFREKDWEQSASFIDVSKT